MIEENSGAKIIDLGCGDGSFAIKIAEKAMAKDIYGVEFLNEAARAARDRGIRAYNADLNESLPFESGSFDIVHANQIIEHLVNTDTFIKEIYRILKFGGYVVVSTPNLASLHNIFSLVLGKQPFPAHVSNEIILGNIFNPNHGMRYGSKGEVHLRIFTHESLKELFEYYGFKVEMIVGVGFYPFPRTIASILSRIDGTHSVYLTMKARKVES